MTENSRKRGFPAWALVLDIVGTLLLAAGIYSVVVGELPIVKGVEPGYIGIALIIVGALLTMPLVLILVQRSMARK